MTRGNSSRARRAGKERLQKVLADRGLGSRRQIENWIREGRIEVNGKIAELGRTVTPADRIRVSGTPVKMAVRTKRRTRVLLYNKPVGEICTQRDDKNRPSVFRKLPPVSGQRWIMVGRLDINTAGLLLFTNDGELANRLMHPGSGARRRYAVRVYGEVSGKILERLQGGVPLEDGMARFEVLKSVGGEGTNHWFEVEVCEGRNRLVRRLWESQGLQVSRLIRLNFAGVQLPRYLGRGQWTELEGNRVAALARGEFGDGGNQGLSQYDFHRVTR